MFVGVLSLADVKQTWGGENEPHQNTRNFDGNREGYLKSGFQRTKALISLKRGKIGQDDL